MRLFKWVGGACVVIVIGAPAWLAYELVEGKGPVGLQVCMETYPGFGKWVCRQALYRLHPTIDEVAQLNATAGLLHPAQYPEAVEARRMLRHYLDAGADINAANRQARGWTALHSAAMHPSPEAVRLLLEFGADPTVRDTQGMTPRDMARIGHERVPKDGYAEVIALLEAATRR